MRIPGLFFHIFHIIILGALVDYRFCHSLEKNNFQAEILVYCSSMGTPGETGGHSPGKGNQGEAGKGYQGKNPSWAYQPSTQYPGNQTTGEESPMILPNPEEIEGLMCNLASSEMAEKEATEEVCKLVKEDFPSVKMQPDCVTVVSALWDKFKARCPKSKESLLAWPSLEDSEKLVCKLASFELVEKEAIEEVCKIIKENFPSVKMQPDCETVVSTLWNKNGAFGPSDADDDEIQTSLEFHGNGNILADIIFLTHLRPSRCPPPCGADRVEEACIGPWCRDGSDVFRVHSAFSILLGLDTTTLRFLNRNLFMGPLGSHPSQQAMANNAGFGGLRPQFSSSSWIGSHNICNMASDERISASCETFHRPNPICNSTIVGWIWMVAETVP